MSSGFVTEKSLHEAEERRKQEWADTYERMGQKPPEMAEEKYDPRSLFEVPIAIALLPALVKLNSCMMARHRN